MSENDIINTSIKSKGELEKDYSSKILELNEIIMEKDLEINSLKSKITEFNKNIEELKTENEKLKQEIKSLEKEINNNKLIIQVKY